MKTIFTILISLIVYIPELLSQPYSPEWSARFSNGESSFDFPTNMAVDSTGNVYVTGKSWGKGTDYDYSTVKYNNAGVFQWEARYNGPGNYIDEPTGIALDKSGNVFVTGNSYGGSTDYDFATIKYNSNGVQQWVDRYNGILDSTDKVNSIAVDNSGNIYISGQSLKHSTLYTNEVITIKYNSAGNKLWVNSFKYLTNSIDYAFTMKLDDFGNVFIGAYTDDRISKYGGDTYLFHTIKYNSLGNQLWIATYQRYYIYTNYFLSLDVDRSGNSFITLTVLLISSEICPIFHLKLPTPVS